MSHLAAQTLLRQQSFANSHPLPTVYTVRTFVISSCKRPSLAGSSIALDQRPPRRIFRSDSHGQRALARSRARLLAATPEVGDGDVTLAGLVRKEMQPDMYIYRYMIYDI